MGGFRGVARAEKGYQCCGQRGEGRETQLGVRGRLVSQPGSHLDAGWIINGGHSHLLGLLGDQCLSDRSPPSEGYFSDIIIAMPTSFSLFSTCCVFPSLSFQPVRYYLIRYIMLEFLHGQASAGQVQQLKSGKLMVSRLLLLDLSTNVNNIFHSYSLLYH